MHLRCICRATRVSESKSLEKLDLGDFLNSFEGPSDAPSSGGAVGGPVEVLSRACTPELVYIGVDEPSRVRTREALGRLPPAGPASLWGILRPRFGETQASTDEDSGPFPRGPVRRTRTPGPSIGGVPSDPSFRRRSGRRRSCSAASSSDGSPAQRSAERRGLCPTPSRAALRPASPPGDGQPFGCGVRGRLPPSGPLPGRPPSGPASGERSPSGACPSSEGLPGLRGINPVALNAGAFPRPGPPFGVGFERGTLKRVFIGRVPEEGAGG